jgi:hypothetical protein
VLALFLEAARQRQDGVAQRRHGRLLGRAKVERRLELVEAPRMVREDDVFLGGVVAEERAARDVGSRGDVVDRDGVEAFFSEQRQGRFLEIGRGALPVPLAEPFHRSGRLFGHRSHGRSKWH